jgi:WD repeat and SOF domain-containing protein 1
MLPEEPLVNDEDEVVDRLSRGLSRDPLKLPTPFDPNQSVYNSKSPCDPLHPRIFHMFWAGPFTDKPYMAVLSFLFTQNLGLDQLAGEANKKTDACRPQFWVWINPGPAASIPNPSARREMYESLAVNPWSAPFLHARFQDVVKFKMWNTTEQMDWNDELRDHWREMPIFNSGGHVYGAPQPPVPESEEETLKNENEGMVVLDGETGETAEPLNPAPVLKKKGGLFEQVGSTSQDEYDRLSVILSDLARFIITHRYGGIYIDADTVFLRDWEELWNWKGQFAYRWSFHDKYNTAVLKLHKGSALGKFLFKTALENGLDFHPMTITTYLKDAGLDALLFRIPDALFDSAWLNMEGYQRDRPPFPYFPE